MDKIKLTYPIMHDGKELHELSYDANAITAEQFLEACALAGAKSKKSNSAVTFRENDYMLHFYLGCMAIIAANPGLDVMELVKAKGFDTLAITDIGLLFTVRRSAATSEENSSDEQSENIPGPTMQE